MKVDNIEGNVGWVAGCVTWNLDILVLQSAGIIFGAHNP